MGDFKPEYEDWLYKLDDGPGTIKAELSRLRTENEALRKRANEAELKLGHYEPLAASLRKRVAELERKLPRQDDFGLERHRYVDRGEPRVIPKDGFINDYD